MYVPAAFAQTDLPMLHRFIQQNSFGLLVTQHDQEPFATHLPFLLDEGGGEWGTLSCHVARGNPQWEACCAQRALAIFSGPHAYISPTWYDAEQVVPTWNYVAVHVYGTLERVDDPAELLDLLHRMVTLYERSMPQPWTMPDSGLFIERLLKQIVGIRLRIDRIEGKWKLNQNHPPERRAKVIDTLLAQGGENATAIAELMRATMPDAR